MAALLPAVAAGIASAVTAASTKKTRNKHRAPKAHSKAVVLFNENFAKSQLKRSVHRAKRTNRTQHLMMGRESGLGYRTPSIQSSAYVGKSTFSPCGPAQMLADVSPDGSLRIRGRGLVGNAAGGGLSDGRVVAFNLTGNASALSTAGVSTPTVRLGPATLDPRLGVIATVFGYYAIRELDLHYVPTVSQYNYLVGVNPAAAGNSTLLTLGLTDQTDYVGTVAPTTVQQIADLPAAVSGPAYQPMTMKYRHKGTRVWLCSNSGEADIIEIAQLVLCGLWSSPSPGGPNNTIMGALHSDWMIDFYRPVYPQGGVGHAEPLPPVPPVPSTGPAGVAPQYAALVAAHDVKCAADAKAPALKPLQLVADANPSWVKVSREPTSPTPSLVEKVTKAVALSRYTNPAERNAQQSDRRSPRSSSVPPAAGGGVSR